MAVLTGESINGEVASRVIQRVLSRCERGGPSLEQVLYETVYQEERRLAHGEKTLRTPADVAFLRDLRRALVRAGESERRSLVRAVVCHYVNEISGHFDERVYRFATSVLPPALGVLLHGGKPSRDLLNVDDRILLEGDIEGLTTAARLGTVVLAPTHVSNLDSLVLGYAIYALGLPPFAYGAGLNLFTHAWIGFFMRNLGAFTVDRAKADPLYKETLKEYATLLLERGQHMLFFPGATRSRSGTLETKLKLGFLGTAVRALGNTHREGARKRPMFVVPCTLTYPLVLEASSLITEYLKSEGGPQYFDTRDEFEKPRRWFDFLTRLAQLDLRIHVRFGTPISVLGHPVDRRGIPRDASGRAIDPVRYLMVDGKVVEDEARDAEYTRMLGDCLLDCYRHGAVALPSSVLAFALFESARRRYPQLDIFRLLRVLGGQLAIPLDEVRAELSKVLEGLRACADRGELVLAPELHADALDAVLEDGTRTLEAYHREPVLVRDDGALRIGDPTLLFYYRNRLDGFGLLRAPSSQDLCNTSSHRRGP